MAIQFEFRGDQVGTLDAIDDDGNGNSVVTVGDLPFLPTDRIIISISESSFDGNGEFLAGGDIVFEDVFVIRGGTSYALSVDPGSKIKESGGGENKEQGDSFFVTNDSIGPSSSGPFTNIPDDQYIFVTGISLSTGGPISIARQDGASGNSNFDTEHGLNNVICFARGTRILTPKGEIAIEELRVGDEVETLDHGPRAIRWVHRRYLPALPRRLWPVQILPHAFAPFQPSRRLVLSPQHRVFIDHPKVAVMFGEPEVFAAARSLIAGSRISQFRPDGGIEYYHLCFETHEIVFANGLPCESFLPGAVALGTLERAVMAELAEVFPELSAPSATAMPVARPVLRDYEARVFAATTLGEREPQRRSVSALAAA